MNSNTPSILHVAALAAAITIPKSAQAQTQLKPGLWEYKMTMEMAGVPNIPGMPGMGGAPMTFTRCLTEEDTKKPGRAFDDGKGQNKCEREEFKHEGNKISFQVRCGGDHPGTGRGEFTLAEDHFEGTMRMSSAGGPAGNMEMTQKMTGKRLGDCKR